MKHGRRLSIGILALTLAACTGGQDADPSTSTTAPAATSTSTEATTTTTLASRIDGHLVVGALLPSPDTSPELAATLEAGIGLAIDDIANAGGALQNTVELVTWQMPGSGAGDALDGFDALLDARMDVLIGAPRSSESLALIPRAAEAGVVVISPTNSDPTLQDLDVGGVFFRTATSDTLEGAALARVAFEAGEDGRVLVLHRDDPFGTSIAERFALDLVELGGDEPIDVSYDATAPLRTASDALAEHAPATVVIVGLEEVESIVGEAIATGATVWLAEPAFGIVGDLVADPASLSGVRGLIHLPFPDMPQSFLDRLQDSPQQPTVLTYAAEAYDAVIIAALAAEAAGSDDAPAMAAALPGVTRDGEVCESYEACLELLRAGADIDYDGIAGAYELSDVGDPTVVTYEWSRYDDEGDILAPLGSITVGP